MPKSWPALINWDLVTKKMPWGPLMLIGAGFALAQAVQCLSVFEAE